MITEAALAPVAGTLGVGAVSLDAGAGLDVLADVIAEQPPGPPDERTAGSIMLYTSGTSGRPKGVLKHGGADHARGGSRSRPATCCGASASIPWPRWAPVCTS